MTDEVPEKRGRGQPKKPPKTPDEIRENRRVGIAKTREIRALRAEELELARRAASLEEARLERELRTTFDIPLNEYYTFVEGLKLGIQQMNLMKDIARAIPFAEEFVRICKTRYPVVKILLINH